MIAHRPVAVLAAALVLLATGCGAGGPTSDHPQIVVTTNILGDVVGELVGDAADVTVLMRPNADPHSFEISAQEAALMAEADLVVSNGLGLEEGLQQNLDRAAESGTEQFVAGDHVDVLAYGPEVSETPGADAGSPDPHFWTDPARMLDVVDALAPELAGMPGVDPALVDRSVADYRERLEDLDTAMTTSFASIPDEGRDLVTNHHVFGYLAERFDFSVVGAVIPGGTTLASPSASDLDGLASAVREAGVPTIFAESSSPDRLVQVLADEAGVDVDVVPLFTESLTAADGDAPTYLQMQRVDTRRITQGLAP
ncbi:metal ABC transporter substrate-binding protein [Nocardioidaceae bacterium]|nr:metal ABC transporter substrate-binding protein [Nocardioidaceae bacterium]